MALGVLGLAILPRLLPGSFALTVLTLICLFSSVALGLQLLVDSLTGADGYGAVLFVARPDGDPVPALRELADGVRLPGDS